MEIPKKEGRVKLTAEKTWNDDILSESNIKLKKNKFGEHELEDLKEHIESISFNISKVYRHAKDRSRKEYNKAKNATKIKSRHFYHDE